MFGHDCHDGHDLDDNCHQQNDHDMFGHDGHDNEMGYSKEHAERMVEWEGMDEEHDGDDDDRRNMGEGAPTMRHMMMMMMKTSMIGS